MLSDTPGKRRYEYVSDYVVFDLETTGTSCKSDAVVEISAVKVVGGEVVDEFSTLVNPRRPIPYFASSVNGIYDDMVADSPTFDVALEQFLEFAGDMVLVGHNINTFDMKFIYRDAEAYWGKTIGNDYIDTLQLARQYVTELSHHKLVDLASYYNLSTEGAHRALNDCRMNQQVYEKIGIAMKNAKERGEQAPSVCPKCGSMLKMRSGRFGKFLGCTGYPECRFTANI